MEARFPWLRKGGWVTTSESFGGKVKEPAGAGGKGEEGILSGGGAEVGIHGGASVARFLGMTTSSVNRMARLEKMTELDAWDK